MASNSSLNSTDSDVFYVEQSSNDQSIPRPNTPIVLHSTEITGDDTRETISISSIASPEPQIVKIDDDSIEPTMPYGNNMNIWRQTHSRCSFINRQFPLRWTGNTLSGKSGHSTLRISHSNWVQDVANELLHGGFTYFFVKFKIIFLNSD